MESEPTTGNKNNSVEQGKYFIDKNWEIINGNFQSMLENKNKIKEIKDEKYIDYFIEICFYDGDKYNILKNKKIQKI